MPQTPTGDRRPLCPLQITNDFGQRSGLARQGIQTLYEVLSGDDRQALVAPHRWKERMDQACGGDVGRPSPGFDRMADGYGLPSARSRPAELLFAVHSYFGLVANSLVRHLVGPLDTPGDEVAELFAWPASINRRPVLQLLQSVASSASEYDRARRPQDSVAGLDLFKALYQNLVPATVRHSLGEYYTPDWLAEHLLDQVGYDGDPHCRLLDPACGSGTFLLAAIRRIRKRAGTGEDVAASILANIAGFDLNPVAVLSARANYLIAIRDWLGGACRSAVDQIRDGVAGHVSRRSAAASPRDGVAGYEVPVRLRDSILELPEKTEAGEQFNVVVGNPPWITWDSLPAAYREATKPLWRRYGLFSLTAGEARHGGGKKDLAMLMLYVAADRYLRHCGRLGMVVTQTAFQTKGAGDGFRRFQLGRDGPSLRVLRVDDFSGFKPFPDAANWTATIVLEKGRPTAYPVPYVKWSPTNTPGGDGSNGTEFLKTACRAEPIAPDRPGSPWLVLPEGLAAEASRLVGPSEYQAHLGANTGGANGVYWVEVLERTAGGVVVRNVAAGAKRDVVSVRQEVEPDLLYPLVRWGDVSRYSASPRLALLLTQDVQRRSGIESAVMRENYPKTLSYLSRFEPMLKDRAAYRRYQQHGPFWSMYNVGPYTVAPVKVVWRRMDRQIRAAVLEAWECPLLGPRPAVPQETCVLVAASSVDEAHYLCAALNSAVVDFLVRSHSVRGGKGFGTPGMLDYLPIKHFDPANPQHRELSQAGRVAHDAARQRQPVGEIQQEIDGLAGSLWGLSRREVESLQRAITE